MPTNYSRLLLIGKNPSVALQKAGGQFLPDERLQSEEDLLFFSSTVLHSAQADDDESQWEDLAPSASTPRSSMDCSEEGLKYLAGYLAFKFKNKCPSLSVPTKEVLIARKAFFVESEWLRMLSYGDLRVPSEQFFDDIRGFESIFSSVHGNGTINKEQGVVARLTKIIHSNYSSYPMDLVKKYVLTRTNIRIKFCNQSYNKAKQEKRNVKKRKQYAK